MAQSGTSTSPVRKKNGRWDLAVVRNLCELLSGGQYFF